MFYFADGWISYSFVFPLLFFFFFFFFFFSGMLILYVYIFMTSSFYCTRVYACVCVCIHALTHTCPFTYALILACLFFDSRLPLNVCLSLSSYSSYLFICLSVRPRQGWLFVVSFVRYLNFPRVAPFDYEYTRVSIGRPRVECFAFRGVFYI